MTAEPFVRLDVGGGLATLTLDRPPLNILDGPTIGQMQAALDGLRSVADLRSIVLRASGPVFSAGVAVEDHLPDRVEGMLRGFHGLFRTLRELSLPLVVAVHGAALGGACEFLCVADWAIASDDARLGFPETRLGSLPPIATVHLARRVGAARAAQLILTGREIGAREALDLGLVDRVVHGSDLESATASIVTPLLEASGATLRAAKAAIEAVLDDGALERVERLFLDRLMKTEDATEGLKAFLEKRPPRWRHR